MGLIAGWLTVSGIGAATAEMFAKAGADVACAWYKGDPHDVNVTVAKVEALGRRAIAIEGDVSKTADTERFVAETIAKLGRIDIVLANAAITRDVAAVELDDERMMRLLEIDLMGVFRTFRAALPALTAQKSGRLLATSSIAGAVQGWPRHVDYSMAKGGVLGMIRSLGLELAKDGITVTGIMLNQDAFSVQILDTKDQLRSIPRDTIRDQSFVTKSPMPSYRDKLNAQELADLVSYLASLKGAAAP